MIVRLFQRVLCVLVLAAVSAGVASAATPPLSVDIVGTVGDSASGQPLPSAEISVTLNGAIVANVQADGLGRFRVHNLTAGTYIVSARYVGFRLRSQSVVIGPTTRQVVSVSFSLTPIAVSLSAVQVSATSPVAVDTRTGDQVFKQTDYHGAPTNTTSQILQQSIAGAVRAPTGEVHIRGQHAEYTYFIDGVPVPAGISGSLNELFDPEVVNQISFQTGGWDAEFGNKNSAVVNVQTRIPSGGFHANASTYFGAYDNSTTKGSRNFNGQSLSLSTNSGRWGFYVSGSKQQSDMRREPVLFDTTAKHVLNFHNNGDDYFGFAKIQYTPGTNDVFNLEANASQTKFAVPFDSSGGVVQDDHQKDVNSFVNFGWRHQFDGGVQNAPNEFFGGLFYRSGSLNYAPGTTNDPQFVFYPSPTPYNLTEDRNFTTYGAKIDYTYHASEAVEFKVGTTSTVTTGHENFSTTAANGSNGPASNSGLSGSDIGVYAQTAISPVEWFEIRTGARYDAHTAPFAGTRSQLSPRIRLNFYPSNLTTLYVYYGRLFLPTNVEDLRSVTSVAQAGVATDPTIPERDDFFEAGLIRRFPESGLTAKLSGFRKHSTPGIDDNTVPGSAIVTSVNINEVNITGIESVLEYRPSGPFSAYVNAAVIHAYGRGPITGGFFPTATPTGWFDLDHDQRVSVTASATYAPNRFFLSGTMTYGSGLTNGVRPQDCNCSYGRGLFDFNSGTKVDPSTIFNTSAGYTFVIGETVLRPQLYVENIFNKNYLLKGAFFSGASVGRPRSVQLRVSVSL